METVFFRSQEEFREWLSENHATASELIVGFYKVKSINFNMTWSQSVDQALCFGWIDGIRRSIDDERYCIRFTPRKPGSTWSNINIRKVRELTAKGLMTMAGTEAFNRRKNEASGIYSFENDMRQLPDEFLEIIKANKAAWDFFSAQPPSYRKNVTHWIISAKQEQTRLNRLNRLISECSKNKRIY